MLQTTGSGSSADMRPGNGVANVLDVGRRVRGDAPALVLSPGDQRADAGNASASEKLDRSASRVVASS
jgi:hypothetical protein